MAKTEQKVNPRHVYGHWLFAAYKLLVEDSDGQIKLTDRGRDFIDHPLGNTVALVDEQEEVLKILTIAAEKGTGRRSDFLSAIRQYKCHRQPLLSSNTRSNS